VGVTRVDGNNNSDRSITEARDAAIGQGVTINRLAIINDKRQPASF
jgi:hypothetical protein